jgi:hypothetical protein
VQSQPLFGSQISRFWQPLVASQFAGHSQLQLVGLHAVLSGQPPQSAGHSQAQLLVGSQDAFPGQKLSQPGGQVHAQSDVLQTVPVPQVPPQSLGHWQSQVPVSHSRLPEQAPPQSESHSQAQVDGLQVVPLGQPPQSAGHSQSQLWLSQVVLPEQLPLQSGAQEQLQSALQVSSGPQLTLQIA